MSIRINPLSVAKGHSHTCELCSQPATILCSTCRVTYYCSTSHQQTDRLSIHTKICSLLGALRSLRPTLGSEDERNKRQLTITLSHHALIDLTRAEATKHLTNHNHLLAIPAALQSLRFAVQVYGKSRLELVPSYLLLAEGNLGLGRLKAAEEYLLYAHWAVVQSGERCAEAMQAELHRQFGLLYVKQGKLHEAIKSYAHDVYHSSLEYGPEHIETSVGVFHMGSTFLLAHKAGANPAAASSTGAADGQQEVSSSLDSALAFYDKYIDIWYKFLINLRSSSPATAVNTPPTTASASRLLPPSSSIHDYLTTPQLHTHLAHLTTILTTRSSLLSPEHIATAEAAYTLAMLKESGGLDVDAEWLYGRAERVYERVVGAGHESVLGVRRAREEMPRGVRLQKTARMTEWVVDEDKDEQQATKAGEAEAEMAQQQSDVLSGETVGTTSAIDARRAEEEKEQLHIEAAPVETEGADEPEEVEQTEEEAEQPDDTSAREEQADDNNAQEPSDAQQAEQAQEAEEQEVSVGTAQPEKATEADDVKDEEKVDNAVAEEDKGTPEEETRTEETEQEPSAVAEEKQAAEQEADEEADSAVVEEDSTGQEDQRQTEETEVDASVVKGEPEEEKQADEEADSATVVETSSNAASPSHSEVSMSAIEASTAAD